MTVFFFSLSMFLFVNNQFSPLLNASFIRLPLIQVEALSLNIKYYLTPKFITAANNISGEQPFQNLMDWQIWFTTCHRILMNFILSPFFRFFIFASIIGFWSRKPRLQTSNEIKLVESMRLRKFHSKMFCYPTKLEISDLFKILPEVLDSSFIWRESF